MTKTIKMSLVAAFAVAGISSVASADVKISGTAAVKYDNQKAADDSVKTLTDTEVNLFLTAKNEDGVKFVSEIELYDGAQNGDSDNIAGNDGTGPEDLGAYARVDQAHVIIPVEGLTVKAGLAKNGAFGAGKVFENGGDSWKTDIGFKASGVKFNVGNVNVAEGDSVLATADKNKMYVKAQGKASGFNWGVQYSNTSGAGTEKTVLNPYVNGSVSGLGVAAEYINIGSDGDGTGMFVGVSKAMGKLSVGVNYVSLSGADGYLGNDFDLDIVDGSQVTSSANDDTTVILIPVSYKINDKLSAGVSYASVDLQGDDVTEMDLSATYKVGKVTSVTLAHATTTGEPTTALGADLEGATHTSVKIATKF